MAAIQQRSSGAAEWQVADYLAHEFLVAELEKQVVGFLVWRQVAADECEILNLAVVPEWRRKGVAKRLMEAALRGFQGDTFLEVRESNRAALALYKLLGFQEVSRRPGYYAEPPETGIVMKFHSC
ncbi:MAG: ribosomal protein S18-alanine N-acetyltransferase [Candidatus Solibacter sp.]